MHNAIWAEHDGSWTWSIEEGKAFEDDHKVLARNDGFPTRGDAKEDMQKAWARLLNQGKQPGRPGQPRKATPGSAAEANKKVKKTAAVNATVNPDKFAPNLPEWAVVVDGAIVALFTSKAVAEKFAKAEHAKSHRVQKIRFGGFAQ